MFDLEMTLNPCRYFREKFTFYQKKKRAKLSSEIFLCHSKILRGVQRPLNVKGNAAYCIYALKE
jgi:hypothetical protein